METIETTVYTFDELSDAAKDEARSWLRMYNDSDNEFADYILENANTVAELLGIDINTHAVKLYGGGTRHEPSFSWSLYTQGSGVAFDGSYSYRKGASKAIREYCTDATLFDIADRLQAIQRKYFYSLYARINTNRNDTGIYCEITDERDTMRETGLDADEVETCLRDFCHWIHRNLETEYDYQNSDEQIDESIRVNEYTFTENGKRF